MRLAFPSMLMFFVAVAPAYGQDTACYGRPGKATPSCTIAPGKVQLETGIADWTADHGTGAREDSVMIGDTAIRVGIARDTEIAVYVTPYVHQRQREPGRTTVDSGFGDMQLMLKHRFINGGERGISVAVQPFITVPTGAHGISDGVATGGVAVPMDMNLPNDWSLALTPTLQSEADADGHGSHALWSAVGALSRPLYSTVTGTAELYAERGYDPAGHQTRTSADIVLAWQPTAHWQFDIGTYFGLNADTPDAELLGGVSRRF